MRACLKRQYSALAQLVEQMTVNHWVAGSSPAGGAKYIAKAPVLVQGLFRLLMLDTLRLLLLDSLE